MNKYIKYSKARKNHNVMMAGVQPIDIDFSDEFVKQAQGKKVLKGKKARQLRNSRVARKYEQSGEKSIMQFVRGMRLYNASGIIESHERHNVNLETRKLIESAYADKIIDAEEKERLAQEQQKIEEQIIAMWLWHDKEQAVEVPTQRDLDDMFSAHEQFKADMKSFLKSFKSIDDLIEYLK